MTTTASWQTAIDPALVQRLWQPVAQPGAMDSDMGDRILARHRQFLAPAPLLDRCLQLQVQRPLEPGTVPIVYPQPGAIAASDSQHSSRPGDRSLVPPFSTLPSPPPSHAALIQAKLDPAAPGPLPLAHSPSTAPLPSAAAAALPSLDPTGSRRAVPDPPQVIQAKLDPTASSSAIAPPPPPVLPVVRPVSVSVAAPAPLTAAALRSPAAAPANPATAPATAGLPLPLVVPLPLAPASARLQAPGGDRPVVRPRAVEANTPVFPSQTTSSFSLPLVQPASSAPGAGGSPAAGAAGGGGDRPSGLPIVPGQGLPPSAAGRSARQSAAASRPIPGTDPAPEASPSMDLNQLADQVERRLKRKLAVERERRGWTP